MVKGWVEVREYLFLCVLVPKLQVALNSIRDLHQSRPSMKIEHHFLL